MVRFLSFITIIFITSLSLNAQVKATAGVDSLNYQIGDFINFSIRVEYDEGIKIYEPVLKDSLKKIELIHSAEVINEEEDGKKVAIYNYTLAKYDSADVLIPPIAVLYQTKQDTALQAAFTNPVSFTVHSLQVQLDGEIKDVKEPVTIPVDWKIIVMWILILLLILAVAYYIYQRYFKKKKEEYEYKEIIVIPPYEEALNSLKELEQKRLWQKGQIKEYHTQITEIIRKYFEKQFFLPALELPTSEFMEQLRNRKGTESILEITQSFFNNADMVKFAKYQPLNPVNEAMMIQAVEIVNKTKPRHVGLRPEGQNVQ